MSVPAARRLMRCYPRAWRARYGDELEALIVAMSADGHVPWRARIDVARAGARERLRGWGFGGPGSDPREQARGGALLVLCSWMVFLVAGAIVQKSSEHWQGFAAGAGGELPGAAFEIVVIAAAVGGGCVLAGTAWVLPRVLDHVREGGWATLRKPARWAAALTVLAAVLVIATVVRGRAVGPHYAGWQDLGDGLLLATGATLMLGALLAWTTLAVRIARGLDLSKRMLSLEVGLASIASVAMLIVTTATAVWWVTLAIDSPRALHQMSTGPVPAPLPSIAALLLMGLATAVATFGATRALRALPSLRSAA